MKEISLREHLKSIAAKGGKGRKKKLSPERRTEIAQAAGRASAKARQAKRKKGGKMK